MIIYNDTYYNDDYLLSFTFLYNPYLPYVLSHCPSFEMAKPSGFIEGIKWILVLSSNHFM